MTHRSETTGFILGGMRSAYDVTSWTQHDDIYFNKWEVSGRGKMSPVNEKYKIHNLKLGCSGEQTC